MGYFNPQAGQSAVDKYIARASRPTYSSGAGVGNLTGIQFRQPGQRDAWERPALTGDEEGMIKPEELLNTAFTAPATVMERPLSLAGWAVNSILHPDEETQRVNDAGRSTGPIEGLGELVRDIPGVGALTEAGVNLIGNFDLDPREDSEFNVGLSPAGDFSATVLGDVGDAWIGFLNSRWAAGLERIADMDPHEKINRSAMPSNLDFVKAFATLGTDIQAPLPDWVETAGDYQKWLNDDIHFTYEQQAAVINKDTGWLDMGMESGVMTSGDDVSNFLAGYVAHPINFVGVGAVSSIASKAPLTIKAATAAFRTTSKVTKVPAVNARIAPRIIEGTAGKAGSFEGVTFHGFTAWGLQATQVAGRATRIYTKGAIGLTAAQIAMNESEGLVPKEVRDLVPPIDFAYRMFRDMSEERPLSDNQAFILASMFFMPGLGGLRAAATRGRDTLRTGTIPGTARPYPVFGRANTAVEKALVKQLGDSIPELAGKTFAQRRAWIIKEYGQHTYDNYLAQMTRGGSQHRNWLDNLEDDPMKHRNYSGTLSEMAAQVDRELTMMNERLAWELQTRRLTPQHVTEAAEAFFYTGGPASGGAITRSTGGVGRGTFDGRAALDNFAKFQEMGQKIENAGGLGAIVPKMQTEFASIEGIMATIAQVKWFAQNGGLTKAQANKLIGRERALLGVDGGMDGVLAKYLTRDKGRVNTDKLIRELEDVLSKGEAKGTVLPERQLMAPERSWAAREGRISREVKYYNRKMGRDGRLRDNVGGGTVEVRVPQKARPATVRQHSENSAEYVQEVRREPAVAMRETEFPLALDEAGMPIESAVQVTQLDRTIAQPAISYRMAPDTAPLVAQELAAVTLEATPGVHSVSVITRGKNTLQQHGLSRNAAEYTWKMKERLSPTEYNELLRNLRGRFGVDAQGRQIAQVTVTNNEVSIIIRAADTKLVPNLERHLNGVTQATKSDGWLMQPAHEQVIVRAKRAGDPANAITIGEVEAQAARGWTSAKRYYTARNGLANVEGRTATLDGAIGDAGVASRARTGQRRPSRAGGSGTAAADAGNGAFRGDGGGLIRTTRYEQSRWGHARGRTDEYVVGDAAGRGESQGRARKAYRDALPDDAPPELIAAADEFQYPTGSTVRTIPGGGAGTYVAPNGELGLWRARRPGRDITRDVGDLLAESSEHATWTRVSYTSPGARRTIADLGDHGWKPVGRTGGDSPVVYLVRDAGNAMPLEVIPYGRNGIRQIYDDIPVMTPSEARTTIQALRNEYHPPGSTVRIEATESRALDIYANNTVDDIERMAAGTAEVPPIAPQPARVVADAANATDEALRAVGLPVPDRPFVLNTTAGPRQAGFMADALQGASSLSKPKGISEVAWNTLIWEVYTDVEFMTRLAQRRKLGGQRGSLQSVSKSIQREAKRRHGPIEREAILAEEIAGKKALLKRADERGEVVADAVRTRLAADEAELAALQAAKRAEVPPAKPLPEGVTTKSRVDRVDFGDGVVEVKYVEAFDAQGNRIGGVNYYKREGMNDVLNVQVDAAHRRQGIATELYRRMREEHGVNVEKVSRDMFEAGGLSADGLAFREGRMAAAASQRPAVRPVEVPARFATTPERFDQAARASQAARGGAAETAGLDLKSIEALREAKLLQTPDGLSGMAITKDGELVQVFRHPTSSKAEFKEVWELASQEATWLNGFENVAKLYERRGWVQVSSIPFDINFAPAGATAARHGDVVFMVNPKTVRVPPGTTRKRTGSWDEGAAVKDEIIGAAPDPAVARALQMARENPHGAGYAGKPSTEPMPLSARAVIEGGMTPEQVVFIRESEAAAAKFIPNLDISIIDNLAGLPPAEVAKLRLLELELRKIDPGFTLSVAPQGATPFRGGQGKAYRQMVGGKEVIETLWDRTVGAKTAQFANLWLNPVYSKTVSREAKAEVYNQFLPHGASAKQVNNFTRKVGKKYDESASGWLGTSIGQKAGVRRYRRPDAMPETVIMQAAREAFGPEILNSIQAAGDNVMDMLQRSNSRFYRNMSKRFSTKDGQGNLLAATEFYYGRGSVGKGALGQAALANRRIIGATKTMYHIIRFLADPRWFALNWFEAEILGITRAGLGAGRLGVGKVGIGRNVRAKTVDESGRVVDVVQSPGIKALADDQQFLGRELQDAGDFNPSVQHDITTAGQMDPRSLSGHRSAVFDVENPQMVRQMLADEFAMRPEFQALKRHYGGTFDGMADEVIAQLARFDEVGIKTTYMDELARMGLDDAEVAFMREMVDTIVPQQQALFKDITHMFHGNVNRANLERLANNPLLYWPVSYQLKVYKNLADFMFNRMGGRQTNWGGAALLYTLMQGHEYAMENDEQYAAVWNDHPEFWQLTGMMLPVTPWEDIGVYMSRPGRFATNWAGAHLGVTKQDPNYPQDPMNFVLRSYEFGPFYTAGLITEIADSFGYELELPKLGRPSRGGGRR
jgi:hypothetical protein